MIWLMMSTFSFRSESRLHLLAPSPPHWEEPSPGYWRRRVSMVSTSPWSHCGADRSPTPWWSLPALRRQLRLCTSMWCPSPELSAPRLNSWLSHLLLVTLLVSSVPLSLIQLIPSSHTLTRLLVSTIAWLYVNMIKLWGKGPSNIHIKEGGGWQWQS